MNDEPLYAWKAGRGLWYHLCLALSSPLLSLCLHPGMPRGSFLADRLPYSIRVLLESAVRNCDNFQVLPADVEKILDWEKTSPQQVEIPFKPARVLLQVRTRSHQCELLPRAPLEATVQKKEATEENRRRILRARWEGREEVACLARA